jgi:hypothetical protein
MFSIFKRIRHNIIGLRWFTWGKCTICGKYGWVFKKDREHEECWLSTK